MGARHEHDAMRPVERDRAPTFGATRADAERIVDVMTSVLPTHGPIREAGEHHLAAPGKLFRGRLALAVGRALGADATRVLRVAAASELLHNASLVHDDIQDEDTMRRGQTSVWYEFGTDVAINLGDYLLVEAFALAESAACGGVVPDFLRASRTIIRGQADEMREKATVADLRRYEELAKAKTGPLLALPAVAAARLGGLAAPELDTIRAALEDFGVAYQLQDDLADLFGLKGRAAPGQDFREGKRTGPMLLVEGGAGGPARPRPVSSTESFASQATRLASSDATRRTQDRIAELAARARACIDLLPAPVARVLADALRALTATSRSMRAGFGSNWFESPENRNDRRTRSTGS